MPRCNMCGNDVIVTLDNICLICNPPNEKEIGVISSIMASAVGHIKYMKSQKLTEKGIQI